MRLWLIVVFVLAAQTAKSEQEEARFVVEVAAKNAKERSQIAQYIHIDAVDEDRVFSVVNSFDFNSLLKDSSIEILSWQSLGEKGLDSYYKPYIEQSEFPRGDEKFHTFEELSKELNDLATAYPGLAQIFSIGKSVEGRDIWGLRITDGEQEGKPAIAYFGTHHAREHVSTEIPFLFAKDLLERSSTDPRIKALLKENEIYVMPLINPDGAVYDITNRNYQYWRKNRKHNNNNVYGVDLNRNYSYGWGTGGSSSSPRSDIYMGKAPFSEPETLAVKNFFLAHKNIKVALSFHTYSELILYPWGGKNDAVAGDDGKIFRKMAREMANMNGYTPEQASDLYIASGDTCDWLYGELSVYCFTFELSPSSNGRGGFYPGAAIIDQVYKANLEPMLYLADYADNPARVLQ